MEVKKYELQPVPRPVTGFTDQDEIYLSIEIGNGQVGGNKVLHNDTLLVKGLLKDPTFIGKATDLQKKAIRVESNILDVNPHTNTCVLTTTWLNQDKKVLFTKIDKGEAPTNGIASFIGQYMFSLICLMALLCGTVQAQAVKFEDLQTPSSPGFILLDNTPSAIERPTTPQGLGVSMLGFLQGNGGALEIAPFWLTIHPKLTAEKMYRNKFPVLYNFSVSIASVKSDSANYLSGGVRTRLVQLFPSTKLQQLDAIRADLVDALANLDTAAIAVLQKQYAQVIEAPVFTLDAAVAWAARSPTNSFNDLTRARWAAWLAFNIRPKGDDFYITVLTRYLRNESLGEETINTDLLDVGTRLNYDFSKFCVSLEYVQRMNLTEELYDDYRLAAIGSYAVTDNLFLTATFGKNFTDVNNIIALAGINFGFSRNKVRAF